MTRNIAILDFDDVEVLDFCGPFEVFAIQPEAGVEMVFNVYIVAEKPGPVIARNGLSENPNYTIANCPQPDIIIIPGGMGTRKEMHNPVLVDWIRQQDQTTELTLSVCTGSLLLAKAAILDGLSATTHWGAIDLLRSVAPNTTVKDDVRWVDNGRVITSAGVSAGIDMSLYVIERLMGPEAAATRARHMQYDHWQSSDIIS
jgi:transcriptional regulator GlxA family with amidase domain